MATPYTGQITRANCWANFWNIGIGLVNSDSLKHRDLVVNAREQFISQIAQSNFVAAAHSYNVYKGRVRALQALPAWENDTDVIYADIAHMVKDISNMPDLQAAQINALFTIIKLDMYQSLQMQHLKETWVDGIQYIHVHKEFIKVMLIDSVEKSDFNTVIQYYDQLKENISDRQWQNQPDLQYEIALIVEELAKNQSLKRVQYRSFFELIYDDLNVSLNKNNLKDNWQDILALNDIMTDELNKLILRKTVLAPLGRAVCFAIGQAFLNAIGAPNQQAAAPVQPPAAAQSPDHA